jgi:hypothetical protein
MRRIRFIFLVTIIFASIGLSVAAQKPNVILIITDDLGNTGLSSWGSSFYETPHIDALAKSGVLFKNFYSASCLCSPARASLMTGKYPQRVGITEYIESTRKTGPHSHETTLPQHKAINRIRRPGRVFHLWRFNLSGRFPNPGQAIAKLFEVGLLACEGCICHNAADEDGK